MNARPSTFQFKITLLDIMPAVWREIQVPSDYSFWDLHVAIQDAMGWQDYHLHAFVFTRGRETIEIGIPVDPPEDRVFLTGWEVKIADYFRVPGDTCRYDYDFGDDWEHEILLEGILLSDGSTKLPRCIGGARACPPEDCGGVFGYVDVLELLKHPGSDEYEDRVGWLRAQSPGNVPFDPERFLPEQIRFDDPHKRWEIAFAGFGLPGTRSARASKKGGKKTAAKASDPGVKQFKKAIAALKRQRKFIPTHDTGAYADDLITILEELRRNVSDPRTGVELVASFFEADAAILAACDDSNGSVGEVFALDAGELFARYAGECPDKEWLVDLVLRLYGKDEYGVRGAVTDRAGAFLPESEMRTLVDRLLAQAEGEKDIIDKRHWYFAVESLAKQLHDAPMFERTLIMSWDRELNAAGIVDIAQVYFDAGDAGTALQRLSRISPDDTFHAYERDHLLLAVHRQLGNRREAAEVAWRIFRSSRSSETLRMLLENIGEAERPRVIAEESQKILKSSKFSPTDAQFLCDMNRTEDADTYLLRFAGRLQEEYYAHLLPLADAMEENEHYLGATVVYRGLLESILSRAISKYYHHGVRYLRKLDQLSKKIDRWGEVQPHNSYKDNLRTTHARKSSFWSRYQGKE